MADAKTIECAKISSAWIFHRVQLPFETWQKLGENKNTLCSAPFYISTDGILLILKDSSLMERELTEDEKTKFHYEEFETMMMTKEGGSGVDGKTVRAFKEKAMKIKVKSKEQDDEEMKEEEQKQEGP